VYECPNGSAAGESNLCRRTRTQLERGPCYEVIRGNTWAVVVSERART
jgi:hypothetical protein